MNFNSLKCLEYTMQILIWLIKIVKYFKLVYQTTWYYEQKLNKKEESFIYFLLLDNYKNNS